MPGPSTGLSLTARSHGLSLTLEDYCCAGGTSIEDLAEKYPEKIIKIPIDVFEGITDQQVSVDCSAAGRAASDTTHLAMCCTL